MPYEVINIQHLPDLIFDLINATGDRILIIYDVGAADWWFRPRECVLFCVHVGHPAANEPSPVSHPCLKCGRSRSQNLICSSH